MPRSFWIRRALSVLFLVFAGIAGVEIAKGYGVTESVVHAAFWAPITVAVFIGARLYQSRRGRHCAICKDTPEMQEIR